MNRAGRLGVGIIGAGRVGPIIGAALGGAGHALSASRPVSDPRPCRGDAAGCAAPRPPEIVARSELVILAVPAISSPSWLRAWPRCRPGSRASSCCTRTPRFGTDVLRPRCRRGRSRSRFTPRWPSPARHRPASAAGRVRARSRHPRPCCRSRRRSRSNSVRARRRRRSRSRLVRGGHRDGDGVLARGGPAVHVAAARYRHRQSGRLLSALVRSTVDKALTLETTPDWEGIVRGSGGDAGWVGRDGLDDRLDGPDGLPG